MKTLLAQVDYVMGANNAIHFGCGEEALFAHTSVWATTIHKPTVDFHCSRNILRLTNTQCGSHYKNAY